MVFTSWTLLGGAVCSQVNLALDLFLGTAGRVAVSGAKASQRSSTLAISSLACPLAGRLLLWMQPAEQAGFSLPLKGDQPLGIGGVDDEDGE